MRTHNMNTIVRPGIEQNVKELRELKVIHSEMDNLEIIKISNYNLEALMFNHKQKENRIKQIIKDIIIYVEEFGDFSNGNVANGYDEGKVRAEDFFKNVKQEIEN